MGDLLKKNPALPSQAEIQADLAARAIVRELRAAALGLGWALAPGLFFGFLAMGFIVSICAGIGWFVWGVII